MFLKSKVFAGFILEINKKITSTLKFKKNVNALKNTNKFFLF